MAQSFDDKLARLNELRGETLAGGGPEKIARLHDIRPDVPVILFTGFRDSFNERQAREAGVLEFMLKPGSHRDLAQLLDRVMARRRAGEA